MVYRDVPETRWFYRVLLRRKTRVLLIHSGVPSSLILERGIGRPGSFECRL